MTRRTFTVIDVVEILLHWHAGRSKAEVARALEVDRSTVRKYTAKAEAEGFVRGADPLSREEWSALVREWFPELVDARARSLTHPLDRALPRDGQRDAQGELGHDGPPAPARRAGPRRRADELPPVAVA